MKVPPVDKANKRFITKLNSVSQWGAIITNPRIIYELEVDEKVDDELLGSFDSYGQSLDYIVHRIKGVTLSDQSDYYKNHDVRVIVRYVDSDGIPQKNIFKAISSNNWKKEF